MEAYRTSCGSSFSLFSKTDDVEATYFGRSSVITGPASAAGSSARCLVASLASSTETDSDEEEPQPTSISKASNDRPFIEFISIPFSEESFRNFLVQLKARAKNR